MNADRTDSLFDLDGSRGVFALSLRWIFAISLCTILLVAVSTFLWFGRVMPFRISLFYYCLAALVEMPILACFLSQEIPMKIRIFFGFWLTACSYPIVGLLLPLLCHDYNCYVVVSEIFAVTYECLLFWLVSGSLRKKRFVHDLRNIFVIVLANGASYAFGVVCAVWGILPSFG